MEDKTLTEGVWRRGWRDTKTTWKGLPFVILDAVVCVVVGSVFAWYWGLGLFLFAMFCVWVGATASAPVRQRNEARRELLRHEGILWIRGKGRRCLDDRMGPVRMKLAWHFNISIANPSKDENLGIRSIILRSKVKPDIHLRLTEGRVGEYVQGPKDEGLLGDIGLEFVLEPSGIKAGKLVFVGESKWFGDKWNNGGLFDDGIIVLIDSQGSEYSFPTDVAHITAL